MLQKKSQKLEGFSVLNYSDMRKFYESNHLQKE